MITGARSPRISKSPGGADARLQRQALICRKLPDPRREWTYLRHSWRHYRRPRCEVRPALRAIGLDGRRRLLGIRVLDHYRTCPPRWTHLSRTDVSALRARPRWRARG